MEQEATRIVVIDPGHGGKNEGGKSEPYIEKLLTIKVANAMKEELEKYDGVKVYMTRYDDQELSLQERVDFAESVNADLFVCLHFNMSEYHTLFGTECWVSAFDECYAKGYDFAKIQNELLVNTGLHNRGIKTRLNSSGIDYYGVIRAATEYGIPSCIVEHCHLDHEQDAGFVDQDAWLTRYGKIDATAVAKYYGLRSDILGIDYSNEMQTKTPVPEKVMGPDRTEPEECVVLSVDYLADKDVLVVDFAAKESDSMLCYYTYSFDGGETYTELQKWDIGKNQMSIEIPMPEENKGDFIIRAHNNYDLITPSDAIDLSYFFLEKEEMKSTTVSEAYQDDIFAEKMDTDHEDFMAEDVVDTMGTVTFYEMEVPTASAPLQGNTGLVISVGVAVVVTIELLIIRIRMKKRKRKR